MSVRSQTTEAHPPPTHASGQPAPCRAGTSSSPPAVVRARCESWALVVCWLCHPEEKEGAQPVGSRADMNLATQAGSCAPDRTTAGQVRADA